MSCFSFDHMIGFAIGIGLAFVMLYIMQIYGGPPLLSGFSSGVKTITNIATAPINAIRAAV